jgi:hypothetical protein
MADSQKGRLHVSKFPHSSTDQSRSEKWRDWDGLLQSAFGELHPLLAAQYSFKCDPTKDYFGLPWHKMLNVEKLDADKEVALHTQFMKAQYGLYHVLRDNFASHEKQIINMHTPDNLAKIYAEKYKWDEEHLNLTWLPFGYLCKEAIGAKYEDSGVTDALSKLNAFNDAKAFSFTDVQKWASTLGHAWHEYETAITDPSHMAAVETLHQIIHSGNDDWRNWALQFSLKQGSKAYTIDNFLEKVITQDKLMKSASKTTKGHAQAMLAVKRNPNPFKKKGICTKPGCSRKTSNRQHKFCDVHYSRDKNNNNAEKVLADVPKRVRFDTHAKKLSHFKKKLAELKNRQKDNEAFIAEATALVADAIGEDVSADDDDSSAVDDSKKKKRRRKKKPSAEANVAEALVVEPSMPSMPSKSKSTTQASKAPTLQPKSSLSKKVLGRGGITIQLKPSGRKVNKGNAASGASNGKAPKALIASMLDGCVTHKFAGCDLPPFFKKK